MTEAPSSDPLALSRRWVERVVVGLGLCPFAARPMARDVVRFALSPGADSDSIFAGCLDEALRLTSEPAETLETTLYVVPAGLERFDDYLDMLWTLEAAFAQAGLEGVLQLASFHPDYCFEGVHQDDPANWTNRSPLPMFHLIREEQLERALAHFPDAEGVPGRNIALLRGMGSARIKALMDD